MDGLCKLCSLAFVFWGNLRHFWLRGASGVAERGIRIDPAHYVGIYKAFSAVRCVWCGIQRLLLYSAFFFR